METSNLATPKMSVPVWQSYEPESGFYKAIDSVFHTIAAGRVDIYSAVELDKFLSIADDEMAEQYLISHPHLFGSMLLADDAGDKSIECVRSMKCLLEFVMWLYAQDGAYSADRWARKADEYNVPLLYRYIELHGDKGGSLLEMTFDISPYTELICSFIDSSRYPGIEEYHEYSPWSYEYWPYPDINANDDPETIWNAIADARERTNYEPLDLLGMVSIYCDLSHSENLTFGMIADAITTLHLRGVRTVARNRDEQRIVGNGASALWWLALDRMRHGRIYQCAACGKVDIATNERGHKRRFCSDACKQWRSKHREIDEFGNYKEWLPPRR